MYVLRISLTAILITSVFMKKNEADEDDAKEVVSSHDKSIVLNVYLVSWVNNPPYYIEPDTYGKQSEDTSSGVVASILQKQLYHFAYDEKCDEKIGGRIEFNFIDIPQYHLQTEEGLKEISRETDAEKAFRRFNRTSNTTDIFIVGATTYKHTFSHFQLLTTFRTSKAVIVVRKADILLLTKFISGIVDCFGILFFATVCAINLAALIWLIEYKFNHEFSPAFGPGIFGSIWYCFVTMTTVGYGDKVPKHFLSRLLCLVWMLFGLMLTAVITTTVMEAVKKDFVKPGMKVAIKDEDFQYGIVINKLSANPVGFSSAEEILEAVSSKRVDAALIEANVAAYNLHYSYEDLKIESEIPMTSSVNAYVLNNHFRSGICFQIDNNDRTKFLSVQAKAQALFVPAYKVTPYYVRTFAESLNKQDNGIVFWLSITAGCLISLGFTNTIFHRVQHMKKSRSAKRQEKRANPKTPFETSPESQAIAELDNQFQNIIHKLTDQTKQKYNSHFTLIENGTAS